MIGLPPKYIFIKRARRWPVVLSTLAVAVLVAVSVLAIPAADKAMADDGSLLMPSALPAEQAVLEDAGDYPGYELFGLEEDAESVTSDLNNAHLRGEEYFDTIYFYTGSQITPPVSLYYEDASGSVVKVLDNEDYMFNYGVNTDAGVDAGEIFIYGMGDYAGQRRVVYFDILPAPIDRADVTGLKDAIVLGSDGREQLPHVVVGGRTLTEGTDYRVTLWNIRKVGTASITMTGINNYTGSITKTFKVVAAPAQDDFALSNLGNRAYNGKAQTQMPLVTLGGKALVAGTDYMVSYRDNVNAGTATIVVTGKGAYAGKTAQATFEISPASVAGATVTGVSDKTCNGQAQTQSPKVVVGGRTLAAGVDYTLSYGDNVNAGTATMTITGKGNYSGSVVKTFKIARASLAKATVTGVSGKTYNGKVQTQSPAVKLGSTTLAAGVDYTLSYRNNVNVGTATMTITGKGNYSGSVVKTFKIASASLASATVTGVVDKMYTGALQTQSPTVKLGSTTLEAGADYKLTYRNNKAVGTATLVVAGKGNYSGSVIKTFKIASASLAGATVTGVVDKMYTGKAKTQAPKVVVNGKRLLLGVDYTLSYKDNVNAGTATMTITGKGSYAGSVVKTFKITAPSLASATVTGVVSKSYSGKAQAQSPKVVVADRKLAAGVDYTLSYGDNVNVGTATMTITGKGNYSGSRTVKFSIGRSMNPFTLTSAPASVSLSAVKAGACSVPGAVKVSSSQGATMRYAKSSGSARLSVNASTGAITVAKGTPAGTYSIAVKATSGITGNYFATTKTVTVRITVKK